jgi:hypothetical protein
MPCAETTFDVKDAINEMVVRSLGIESITTNRLLSGGLANLAQDI